MSFDTGDLKGKVCVVTGAAKSIGYAVAEKYGECGAKVALIDIDPNVEQSALKLAGRGYAAKGYVLDITDRAAVLKCFSDITDNYGDIYALVNNAGIVDTRPFAENDDALFQKMFAVNVFGAAYCIQGAIEGMKKKGEGKIINFSSKSGKTGSALMAPYSAAKGAVIAMTQALAFEYAPYGININAVCPGITDATGVWSEVSRGYVQSMNMQRDEIIEKFTAKIPLGRLTEIDDIVDFIYFLTVSGNYCTGQAFNITGGREMH